MPFQRNIFYPKETRTSTSADVDQESLSSLELLVADLIALIAAEFVSNGHLVVHDS
jgi:hypothetical protein